MRYRISPCEYGEWEISDVDGNKLTHPKGFPQKFRTLTAAKKWIDQLNDWEQHLTVDPVYYPEE